MKLATGWFLEKLQAPEGAKARAYLRGRGLTAQTQGLFQLGYAPEGRSALKEFLAGKGIAKDQIEACGLVVFGDDIPVSYDRFRDRIMYPIEDSRGRVIAFGGRAMAPDAPAKYLNSPETELFHKGQILYNAAKARKAVQEKGAVIAVEGYMDVIALAQAGFHHVVAPLGTALTENQLELLWRMAPEPILCFDGDSAGMRAALQGGGPVAAVSEAGKIAALRASAGRQGPGRSGEVRRAGGVCAGARRGAAAHRHDLVARDGFRLVRHAGAPRRAGAAAAQRRRAHRGREHPPPLRAGSARPDARLLWHKRAPAPRRRARAAAGPWQSPCQGPHRRVGRAGPLGPGARAAGRGRPARGRYPDDGGQPSGADRGGLGGVHRHGAAQ